MTANSPPPPQPPSGPVPDYQVPRPGVTRGSVGRFFLRMMVGCGLTIAAIVLGVLLAMMASQVSALSSAGSPILFIFGLPSMILFVVFLVVTIRRRAFGYLTGWVTAFVLAVVGLVVLIASLCGFFR